MNEELTYRIAINMIDGIGPVLAKEVIAYCGGAEAVFREKKKNLLKIPGLGPARANAIVSHNIMKEVEKEVAFIEKNGIRPLYFLDEEYPKRLQYCDDGPVMLYCKGNMNLNAQKVIAMVGTRASTDYGKKVCEELVEGLKAHRPLIVSGLAYGIDICAHKAAVKHGLSTVAVLAHGLQRLYPQQHLKVAQEMQEAGGLITDFSSTEQFLPANFPSRNRIIAGLSDAVVVVESAEKGGSLITAEIANSYNRDVFAVPGRTDDAKSSGCNFLIKTQRAHLAESAKDIEYIMGWKAKEEKKAAQKTLFTDISPEEKKLVELLQANGKLGIDHLCLEAGMPASQVAPLLLNLEFSGIVRTLPGKVYELN